MNGNDSEENLIDLFGREHFIAHKLLYEENPNNKDLAYAYHILCVGKSTQNRYHPTAEEIELARKAAANAWRGQHHTEETKQKISQKLLGIQRSEETKQKLRKINTGKHHSEETKKKQSQAHNPRLYKNLDTNFIGCSRDISIEYKCGIRTIPSAFERHPNSEIVNSIGYHWIEWREK